MRQPIIIESGKRTTPLAVYDASVSLNIKPLSTATITLPEGQVFPSRTYLEIFTEQGSAGIFRTRSPRVGIGAQNTTVELEHAIADIGDYLVSNSIEKETTMSTAIKELFKYYKGKNWKLGTIAKGSTKVIESTEYDSVLEAINDLLDQEPTLMLTFDFSAYPWTVNVAEKPTAITAEGRLARNVRSATITTDDTDLCTRVYMEALPGTKGNVYGHLDADTISKYGTIEKELSGKYTQAQAKRVAELYLKNHKEPKLTVQIDAVDLSKITGEALDTFTIGKKMRLALPDYGITKEQTITQLSWGSIFNNPNAVTVTLSDDEDTVILNLNQQSKQAGKSARRASTNVEKASTRWEQSIKGVVDENGNVTVGSISLAINNAGESEFRLSAKRVFIGNKDSETVINGKCKLSDVTANYISTKIAGIKTLNVQTVKGTDFLVNNSTGMGAISLKNAFTSAQIKKSGNTYTLRMARASTGQFEDIGSFSRAVTSITGSWSGGTLTLTPNPQGEPSYKLRLRTPGSDVDTCLDIIGDGNPTIMADTDNKWIEAPMQFVTRKANGTPTNVGDAFTMGFNATAVHTAGRNAVQINDPTFSPAVSSSPSTNYNTVTFKTNAPTQQSNGIYLSLSRSNSWDDGVRTVYLTHTDSDASHRMAKIDVSIPSTTVKDQIYTYGNSYPTSINGGKISKSGITAGKYMVCTTTCGDKDVNIRFLVQA